MNARDQLASDIIVGAIEGGTGYWAFVTQYDHGSGYDEDGDERAATATIRAEDEPGNPIEQLTAENILAAMELVTDPRFRVREDIREIVREALKTNDAGDCDADVCDAIVQAHAFGKIVYG